MMCDFILVTLVVAGMRANPIFCLGIGVGLPWNHVGCKQPNICELGNMQALDGGRSVLAVC